MSPLDIAQIADLRRALEESRAEWGEQANETRKLDEENTRLQRALEESKAREARAEQATAAVLAREHDYMVMLEQEKLKHADKYERALRAEQDAADLRTALAASKAREFEATYLMGQKLAAISTLAMGGPMPEQLEEEWCSAALDDVRIIYRARIRKEALEEALDVVSNAYAFRDMHTAASVCMLIRDDLKRALASHAEPSAAQVIDRKLGCAEPGAGEEK